MDGSAGDQSGLTSRDPDVIDRVFEKRLKAADASSTKADAFLALQAIAVDFDGLKDVSAVRARTEQLGRDSKVLDGLKRADDEDELERRTFAGILNDEPLLSTRENRAAALASLARQWKALSERARDGRDSPERRMARRVLNGLSAGMTTKDPDYLKIIAQYRLSARP